jgi:hypothetical protein
MEFSDYPAQSVHTGQQWLTTVQHNLHRAQSMCRRVLGDPLDRSLQHGGRESPGLVTPALIGRLVDVAMIAGEIAPAVDLQDELIQR